MLLNNGKSVRSTFANFKKYVKYTKHYKNIVECSNDEMNLPYLSFVLNITFYWVRVILSYISVWKAFDSYGILWYEYTVNQHSEAFG